MAHTSFLPSEKNVQTVIEISPHVRVKVNSANATCPQWGPDVVHLKKEPKAQYYLSNFPLKKENR